MLVTVKDEQTSLPLPGVVLSIAGPDGVKTAITDSAGTARFNSISEADYTISGILNGVKTTERQLHADDFNTTAVAINIPLTQNDLRFTLAGRISDKDSDKPEGRVVVNAHNTSLRTADSMFSRATDGSFDIQLAANSDFNISGKKAGYISNIEKISTKGLNRNTTLDVKLVLTIEQEGYGATKLVNGCKVGVKCTDAQHEQNRRTEFKVLAS